LAPAAAAAALLLAPALPGVPEFTAPAGRMGCRCCRRRGAGREVRGRAAAQPAAGAGRRPAPRTRAAGGGARDGAAPAAGKLQALRPAVVGRRAGALRLGRARRARGAAAGRLRRRLHELGAGPGAGTALPLRQAPPRAFRRVRARGAFAGSRR
jgi:hypothetical protein